MTEAEREYKSIAASLAAKGVADSQMFGMPCLKIGGKAFAGFYENAMVFKLTGDAHESALSTKGAHLFDPMDGRPMKEWVVVPAKLSKEWPQLANDAMEYVAKGKKK